MMLAAAAVAASLAQVQEAPAAQVVTAPSEQPAAEPAFPAPLILPKGTMVRLMVLREVNSRDHQAGHRFVLRVDEEVAVDGVTVIPVGAKAWGEVVASEGTGGAGKSGRLNARLLYVEASGKQVPVTGERSTSGSGGTGQVVGGVVAFGLFGLLMKGNNATLKAGEILNGYTLGETSFDRPTLAAVR